MSDAVDSPPEARRQTGLVIGGVIIAAAALTLLIVLPQTNEPTGLLDLRIYTGASRTGAAGGSVYDFRSPRFGLGSTYPPAWSLLIRPIGGIDVHLLEYGWTALNLAMWGGTLLVLVRGTRRTRPVQASLLSIAVVWLLTIPSAAVWNTLNQGQVNILLWFLIVADLTRVTNRDRGAGVRTGIAAAIKITPALFGIFYVVARRWRAAIYAGTTAVAITAVAWILAPGDSSRFWTDLVFDTSRVGDLADSQNNSLAAALHRATDTPAVALQVALVMVGVTVFSLAAWRFARAIDAEAIITAATVGGCGIALVSPISWMHHLVFLCFPVLLFCGRKGWKPKLLAAVVIVALIDPGGFGRSGVTSTIRMAAMVLVILFADRLQAIEVEWRTDTASLVARNK